MFPEKIRRFVSELTTKTERGEFSWVYDDLNSSVSLETTAFHVVLRYSFNETEECGEYIFFYSDHHDGRDYRFYTNQFFNDYATARRLYDSAQSSGLSLPF